MQKHPSVTGQTAKIGANISNNSGDYIGSDSSAIGNLVLELRSMGLSQNEARVLVSLLVNGQSIASDVSRSTGIQRTEVYQTLYGLQSKGLVFSTFDKPQKYYSLAVGEIVDALIEIKQRALRELAARKGHCEELFCKAIESRVAPRVQSRENYQVLTGMDAICTKIARMILGARSEVLVLVSEKKLRALVYMDVMDRLQSLPESVRITLKVMGWKDSGGSGSSGNGGSNGKQNNNGARNGGAGAPQRYDDMLASGSFVSVDEKAFACDLVGGTPVPLNMVIVDREQIIILPEEQSLDGDQKEFGFYTNTRSLASTFAIVHDQLK